MDIKYKAVTVRELFEGYVDDSLENEVESDGVRGYYGRLNIRPDYQRELVYDEDEQIAVIQSILKDYHLNTMYWALHGENDNGEDEYQLIDGQQRILSICHYLNNELGVDGMTRDNLIKSKPDKLEKILDHELMVYVCDGDKSEKLEWFEVINTHGKKLNQQELLNATYHGTWLNDAKKYFSKNKCDALGKGIGNYIRGSAIRQEYLATVLKWASRDAGLDIKKYMSDHQNDLNAQPLINYFDAIIDWVEGIFPLANYRKEMKGLDWGILYSTYKDKSFDADVMEAWVKKFMKDDDVTKKSGIYEYVLSGRDPAKEKLLNIRAFDDAMRRSAYEKQNGFCAESKVWCEFEDMHADHIEPWSEGGPTNADNCQMLSAKQNRIKSNKR